MVGRQANHARYQTTTETCAGRRTPDENAKLHDDAGSTPHAAGSRPRRRFGSAAQRESRSVSAGGVVWQSCQHRRKLLIPKGGPLAQLGERRVRNATGIRAKTPINRVFTDQIVVPKYSEVLRNRLAVTETAGTPAGTQQSQDLPKRVQGAVAPAAREQPSGPRARRRTSQGPAIAPVQQRNGSRRRLRPGLQAAAGRRRQAVREGREPEGSAGSTWPRFRSRSSFVGSRPTSTSRSPPRRTR